MDATSYTYLIGWPELDRWYYGVRYAQNCHPDEFWKTYKTSSKTVKEYSNTFGEPPVQIIRQRFESAEKARLWESTVLKRLGVVHNKRWLNKTDNKAIETHVARIIQITEKQVQHIQVLGLKNLGWLN